MQMNDSFGICSNLNDSRRKQDGSNAIGYSHLYSADGLDLKSFSVAVLDNQYD